MAIAAIAGLATVGGAMAAAGTLAIGWAAGLTAFAIGAGLSIVSRALMPKPDFGGMMGGVTGTVREPASTRKVIYGQCRAGGSVVFLANSNQNEYLYLVIAFAAHEIESYEEFYFNDELVWSASGGFVGDWGSWALINKYTGTQTTADSTLSNASSFWGADHKLLGVSYAMVRLKWDKDRKKFPNGVPNISAVIKGKKVYDPRSPASPAAWSQNPALCLRDYLTNTYYGLGEDAANLDDDSFEVAADICDEQVSLGDGGVHDKYHCDGVIDTGSSIKNNIEALLASMGGRLGYSGGKYFAQASKYITPVLNIDETVMVGEMNVQTRQSRRGVYNAVKGVFLSEEENYTLCDYPAQISSSYALQDGDPVYLDMPLPFVTNNIRAQRLAKIALLKSRQQLSVTVPLNLVGLKLKAGDFITITNERMSWSSKPFEVLDYTLSASSDGAIIVNVSCIETDSSVYDWTTSDEEPFNQPSNPTTNDGSTVAAPTDLDLTETTNISGDGAVVDALLIEWVASVDGFVDYYEVLVEEVATGYVTSYTTSSTSILVSPIRTGTNYAVSVIAVNTIGAKSTALTGSLSPLGDQEAPLPPTGTSATGAVKSIQINWTNALAADLAYVNVYRSTAAAGTYTNIATVSVKPSSTGTYVDLGLDHGTRYYYKLESLDRSGNDSALTSAFFGDTTDVINTYTPRQVTGYVYYQIATDTQPSPPTATEYDFDADSDTNPFTDITANWDINPPTPSTNSANTGDPYWVVRFTVTESTYGDSSPTIDFSSVFQSTVFDGLVTFQNLNNELGDPATSLLTTIDGGLIRTGVVDLANDSGMAVRQGKTGYSNDAATGFWLGNDGGVPRFNIGTSSKFLKFDGSSLFVKEMVIRDSSNNVVFDANEFDGTYIKDLSVDTVQLAGEAVTVPVGDDGTSSSTSLNTSYQLVGSVRLSWGSGEKPANLICIGGLQTGAASQDQGLTLEIRRVYGGGSYTGIAAVDSKASGYGAFTNVGAFFEIGSTIYTYVDIELYARTSAGTCSAGNYYISAIGAKR